jgi:hypothetical protein
MRKYAALLLLPLLTAIAAYAGVVVINTATGTGTYVANPVKFVEGSNANALGLPGVTIDVTITNNGAEADVTFPITHGKVWIIQPLNITNTDNTNDYYIWIKTDTPVTAPGISVARMYIDLNGDGPSPTEAVDLMSSSLQYVGLLSAGETAGVYLYFEVDYSGALPQDATFGISLYYSLTSEEPPT